MLFVNPGCRWSSVLVALVGLVLKPYPDLQAAALDITFCRHSNSWGCLGQVQSVPPINSKSTWSFLSKQMGVGWVTRRKPEDPTQPISITPPSKWGSAAASPESPTSLSCHLTHVSWVSYSCPFLHCPQQKKSKNQISLPFIRKVQSKKKKCGFVVVILGIFN